MNIYLLAGTTICILTLLLTNTQIYFPSASFTTYSVKYKDKKLVYYLLYVHSLVYFFAFLSIMKAVKWDVM